MPATKLQSNWTGVQHGSTNITRVTSVTISAGGSLATFSADTDVFDTAIVNLSNKPRATVVSADTATIMGFAAGTTGSFSATHKDAKKQSGGDILYVLANAVVENADTSGDHGQFGTATLSLLAYSSDGTTNPLSFTRA